MGISELERLTKGRLKVKISIYLIIGRGLSHRYIIELFLGIGMLEPWNEGAMINDIKKFLDFLYTIHKGYVIIEVSNK